MLVIFVKVKFVKHRELNLLTVLFRECDEMQLDHCNVSRAL